LSNHVVSLSRPEADKQNPGPQEPNEQKHDRQTSAQTTHVGKVHSPPSRGQGPPRREALAASRGGSRIRERDLHAFLGRATTPDAGVCPLRVLSQAYGSFGSPLEEPYGSPTPELAYGSLLDEPYGSFEATIVVAFGSGDG